MNLTTDQIISIISAVGISTIISTIFTFVQANKKNNLDFITRERSEWRKGMKGILVDLNSVSEEERKLAISRLKTQINPYGKNREVKNSKMYFMNDGHIWDLLNNEINEIDFDKLSLYINLLLKYDWERSKSEIKFKPSTFFDKLLYVTLLLANFYACILAFKISFIYLILSMISLILVIFQPIVTKAIKVNPSKNENERVWVFCLLYAFPYIITIIILATIFNLLKISFGMIAFVGLLAYEVYFLSLLVSIEDDYIREVERHVLKKQKPKEWVRLSNTINLLENRIYNQYFNSNSLVSLQKKEKNC